MAAERTFFREDLERIFEGKPLLLGCITSDMGEVEWPVPESALLEQVHGRVLQRFISEEIEEAMGPTET